MNIIYYHSADHDGKASGAIAFNALNRNAKLIGIDYKRYDFENEFNSWENSDYIYLLDFSFEITPTSNNMKRAFDKLGDRFIWIDHHKTPIEAVNDLPIKGYRKIGTAACKLTWEYFHPSKEVPEAIELLARYDVFDLNPKVEKFQLGAELLDTNPESQNWITMFKSDKDFINDIVKQGDVIQKYVTTNDARFAERYHFEREIEGYKAIVINGKSGSKVFDSVWKDGQHELMLSFNKMPNGKTWKVSVYSKENGPDVSVIAKKYGGGGHEHAAGFEIDTEKLKELLSL